MRLFALIVAIVLFTSCKSLKPVTSKSPAENNATQRTASPQFIENITINQQQQSGTIVNTRSANNDNGANIFTRDNTTIEGANELQLKYSILMDMPVEQLQNFKLLQYMDEWYGTRYHFGGTGKDGIDCSAFACGLMSNVFGVELPRMAKDQYKASHRIHKNALQEGDLVFFHTTRKGVSHVGVYIGNNKFVHASLNYGVTISDLGDPYYARTYVGAGRTN